MAFGTVRGMWCVAFSIIHGVRNVAWHFACGIWHGMLCDLGRCMSCVVSGMACVVWHLTWHVGCGI